jgi:hypothetical protein
MFGIDAMPRYRNAVESFSPGLVREHLPWDEDRTKTRLRQRHCVDGGVEIVSRVPTEPRLGLRAFVTPCSQGRCYRTNAGLIDKSPLGGEETVEGLPQRGSVR